LSLCSKCGTRVGVSAEQVYRRGQGKYPLLCDACMLWEMGRRSSERATCESCGRRLELLRRNAITRMEREGLSPPRTCLTCLKKQLDSSLASTPSFTSPRTNQLLQMDNRAESKQTPHSISEHRVLCPWCLSTLSDQNSAKLRWGHVVTCDDCGTTLTSDIQ
jgi:protein-arginine kinase activator protein McsA